MAEAAREWNADIKDLGEKIEVTRHCRSVRGSLREGEELAGRFARLVEPPLVNERHGRPEHGLSPFSDVARSFAKQAIRLTGSVEIAEQDLVGADSDVGRDKSRVLSERELVVVSLWTVQR